MKKGQKKKTKKLPSYELAMEIAELAKNKKAMNISVLDVTKTSSFADYLVITSGESTPQLRAICKEIEDGLVKKCIVKKARWQGKPESNWLILDLGSVVVHVMSPEERDKYKLEDLWEKTAVTYHL